MPAQELEEIWKKRIEDMCLLYAGKPDYIETVEKFKDAFTEEIRRIYLEGGFVVTKAGELVEKFDDVRVIVKVENEMIHAVAVPSESWKKRRNKVWRDNFVNPLVKETLQ